MRLDGRHLRSEKLLQQYLTLSILRGETLLLSYPTPEMLHLIKLVAPFAKASVMGAGLSSEECVFVPSKIVKKQEIFMDGTSPVPLLQTLLLPFLFCGHKVTITLQESSQVGLSTYYFKDVLLPYLHKYILTSSFFKEPNGDIKFTIKGKYLLEQAPPLILRKNNYLVSLRGEAEIDDESIIEYLDLTFKDLKVPLRINRKNSSGHSIVHIDALYGTSEGYDNDFAYVVYKDIVDKQFILKEIDSFKEELKQPRLSQDIIEDLLLYIGLLGGQLPFTYDETDFLLEELNKEINGIIEKTGVSPNNMYIWSQNEISKKSFNKSKEDYL